MFTKLYPGPVRLAKLSDELVAAFPTWIAANQARFSIETADSGARITWPASTALALVDAVVAAHDPTTPSASEQQTTADGLSVADLKDQYQTMLTKLDAIQADMATLSAHATTLSTVTVTTLAQVQAVLRSLGSDLVTLTDDVNALASGAERVLKVARVLVRRQGEA